MPRVDGTRSLISSALVGVIYLIRYTMRTKKSRYLEILTKQYKKRGSLNSIYLPYMIRRSIPFYKTWHRPWYITTSKRQDITLTLIFLNCYRDSINYTKPGPRIETGIFFSSLLLRLFQWSNMSIINHSSIIKTSISDIIDIQLLIQCINQKLDINDIIDRGFDNAWVIYYNHVWQLKQSQK